MDHDVSGSHAVSANVSIRSTGERWRPIQGAYYRFSMSMRGLEPGVYPNHAYRQQVVKVEEQWAPPAKHADAAACLQSSGICELNMRTLIE